MKANKVIESPGACDMDSYPKTRSVLGGVVMVVGFLTWMLSQMHGCDLKSFWIEIPILLCILALIPPWVRSGSTLRFLYLRFVAAIAFLIALQIGYLSWLHSDYFPRWLLLPKPRIHHQAPGPSAVANLSFNHGVNTYGTHEKRDGVC